MSRRNDVEITVRIDEANLAALTREHPVPASVGCAFVRKADGTYRLAVAPGRLPNSLTWADTEESS